MKRADLDEYAQLEATRLELTRQLATLKDRCDQLLDGFRKELERKGKEAHKLHGYTVSLVPGSVSVPWAKEYLAAMGPAKVDELKQAAAAKALKKVVVSLPSES